MSVKVYDWIRCHADRTPHKIAGIDLFSERRFSYREMDRRIGRLGHFLRHRLGIQAGDRVAVLSRNSTDIFDIQFACQRLGALFMPLNWRLALPELEFILEDSTPKALIYDSRFADHAEALAKAHVPAILEMDLETGESAFEMAIARAEAEVEPAEISHGDISTILYTSGTTGLPKGVLVSYAMNFWNAVNIAGPYRLTADTVNLAILPLFHTGGLNCCSNPCYHLGATNLVMREFDPGRTLGYLTDLGLGITHTLGVPANFLFMSQQPDFAEADLSTLKVAGVGGAPTALSILETWAAKGVALQQVYGMTETSPLVLALAAEDAVRKPGSAGKPVLHGELRLVDENGVDVEEPDSIGEIWVKGPHITPGYWNRPEVTAEAFVDGWLKTGDAARRDVEGYYYIVDRWKDMYISGGENVYPAEVENVIYRMPEIAEVAVIGLPDERWGEVGQAVVALKPGCRLSEVEILKFCDGKLARYKLPRSVRFVAALPRNATGKVLKRELRG